MTDVRKALYDLEDWRFEFDACRVPELREFCRNLGLSTTGNKPALVERLTQAAATGHGIEYDRSRYDPNKSTPLCWVVEPIVRYVRIDPASYGSGGALAQLDARFHFDELYETLEEAQAADNYGSDCPIQKVTILMEVVE